MATVLTKPAAASKADTRIEQELARTAGRIRFNDLLAGGLTLAALVLGYAVAAVLLDKALDLPAWVRQAGFGGFVLSLVVVGYFLVIRPMRRAINPRFTARRVEETIPDAKNAIINWVDLRDPDLLDGVRTAVGKRAAQDVSVADVNRATESKRVVWLGAAVGLLVATLAVLVIVFKPTPFISLVGRTFNPFTAGQIASRTVLTLQEPEGGDVTVTTGEPLTVTVLVGGSVPDADSDDHVRLLVRHNPTSSEYSEIPLEQGETARVWTLRVPQSVIQNGFWYKVSAGDAVTAEHRVTVRSKPLVKSVEVRYEYPDYTRLKPETATDRNIDGYRGTKVTLTAQTNRQVKRGWMQFDGQQDSVPGEVVGENKDSLRFTFTLTENGAYRLGFTPVDGEPSEPTNAYPIRVVVDQAPRPEITSPIEDQASRPANGQLEVNGVVGDDFGIKTVALRMKLVGPEGEVPLKKKVYREGTSFQRETDKSYPTTVEYKDSVKLAELKDARDKPVALKPGDAIEYWLEAEDNREPKANVGKSNPKRLVIAAPEPKPDAVQQKQQQRQSEERAHQKQQDEKFKTENRDPQQPRANEQQQPQTKPGPGTETNPQQGGTEAQPPMGGAGDPMKPQPQEGPKPPDAGAKPMTPDAQPTTPPQTQPMGIEPNPNQQPGKADDGNLEEKLNQADKALQREQQQPGTARNQDPEGPKPEAPPADPKGGKPSGEEAAPKAGEPTDGMGQPMGQPSAGSKDGGKLEERPPQSEEKAPPKPDSKPEPGKPSGNAIGEQPKEAPVGGKPGEEKSNKEPAPQDTKDQPEPGQGTGETKGNPEPTRAQERKTPPQGGAGDQDPNERSADARGQKATDPASSKGAPPDSGDPMKGAPESKPGQPGSGAPEQESSAAKPGAGDTKQAANERPKNKPEPGELSRENGEGSEKVESPKDEDVERLSRKLGEEAKNLASDDQRKRQQAEDKFKDKLGKKDQQKLQQAAQDLKSNDPQKQAQAQKDIDQLSKKAAQNEQAQKPSKEELDKWKQKAQDLASDDNAKREQAEKDFDNAVGKENRDKLQQAMKDMKSGNPDKQQPAKEQLEKTAGQGAGADKRKPTEEELKKWQEKANDLNSTDAEKKKQAEQDFDNAIGEEKRKQLQQNLKDMQSGDSQKQNAARENLQQMAKEAAKDEKLQGQPPSKEDIEKAKQTLNDLNSDDKQKREAAEKAVDQAIGEKDRKQIQQDLKDAQSPDKSVRDAAQNRIGEQSKQLAQQQQQNSQSQNAPKPTREDIEKAEQTLQDLNSPDNQKREAAEKAMDQAVGEKERQQLQKDLKDVQSPDEKVRDAAKQRLAERAKKLADEQAKNAPKPSKEDVEKATKLAQDLASQDKATREQAEKELDEKIGKPAREELQKNAQDAMSQDPQKADAARKKLEEMAKQNLKDRPDWRPGAPAQASGPGGKPLKDDPRNRLKSAELRLVELEKKKYDAEFKKNLGYDDEQYQKFLDAVRKRVEQQREEVAKSEQLLPGAEAPQGPASINVNQGATNPAAKPVGAASTTAATNPGTAPPGYSDAQKKFAEEAAKLRREREKK